MERAISTEAPAFRKRVSVGDTTMAYVDVGDAMTYIETHHRTSLFYTDCGAGRPMVFVASAWLDSRMWEFQIPFLVDHDFRCIAPSL